MWWTGKKFSPACTITLSYLTLNEMQSRHCMLRVKQLTYTAILRILWARLSTSPDLQLRAQRLRRAKADIGQIVSVKRGEMGGKGFEITCIHTQLEDKATLFGQQSDSSTKYVTGQRYSATMPLFLPCLQCSPHTKMTAMVRAFMARI